VRRSGATGASLIEFASFVQGKAGAAGGGYARSIVRSSRLVLASAAFIVCGLVFAGAAQAYIYWAQEQYRQGIGRAALDGSGINSNYIPSGGGPTPSPAALRPTAPTSSGATTSPAALPNTPSSRR